MAPPVIPPPMTVDGDVVAVHSYWTSDGSRIVTEAQVRAPDGSEVTVSQLGGTVNGIGMIMMPGPPLLEMGMKVAVAAHRDQDQLQREHVVLDSVKVLAAPAGFVRTGPTKGGKSLYWESGCVFVTVDSAGTTAIAGDAEFDVIDASIETWNTGTASCSYLNVVNEGRKAVEVGRDNINAIKFRDTTWGRPAVGDDPARNYAHEAAGITTVVFIDDPGNARDGAILDADVELNGVDFAIAVNGVTTSGRACKSELQNTLTHELGHLHGLEHPCRASALEPARVDDQGREVPLCSSTSDPRILNSTMYNFQECGETKKEMLSNDDIASMCSVYPIAKDPKKCDHVGATSGGCCSASGDRPEAAFALAGLALLWTRRRRKTSPRG